MVLELMVESLIQDAGCWILDAGLREKLVVLELLIAGSRPPGHWSGLQGFPGGAGAGDSDRGLLWLMVGRQFVNQ